MTSCKNNEANNLKLTKNKIIEKFDIERFKNYPSVVSEEEEKNLTPTKDTLTDGTIISYSWWDDENKKYYSKKIVYPVPTLLAKTFTYYENGTIKQEQENFIGEFFENIGITKYYDEKGYLTKTVDENIKYKDVKIKLQNLFEILKKEPLLDKLSDEEKEHFNTIFSFGKDSKKIVLEDIYKFLKRDKILNPYVIDTSVLDTEDRFRLQISFDNDKKNWNVIKELYPFGQIWLNVDANTGKVSNKEYQRETRH